LGEHAQLPAWPVLTGVNSSGMLAHQSQLWIFRPLCDLTKTPGWVGHQLTKTPTVLSHQNGLRPKQQRERQDADTCPTPVSSSAGVRNDVWLSMSEMLRARVLSVAVALVGEVGYARMTVKRVARSSGISQETFHECFEDLDECVLAAFEDALRRIAAVVIPAYEVEREWPAKVRAAVAALLDAMEDEPALGTFLFVGALGAGPKVLACRMQALERLKIAFEDGIDDAGGVAGSVVGECSPLSAEGTVNGGLGILYTRLLAGSPLARRPLGELVGPLTAMIVLPYVGRATAWKQLPTRPSQRRPSSRALPKPGARKPKRARLTAKQRAILKALKDGPLTVRELVDATGMSDQTVRNVLRCLVEGEKVMKTKRDGRVAYDLPSKGDGGSSSNGTGASNGHDRSVPTKAMLRALDPQISEREFRVLAAIGELNARGSGPSNREIRDATELEDPAEVSKLLKQLARLGLLQSTATGRQTYAWRLTSKGTDLLHELQGQTVGGTNPADARA
jgi:AcrR family transcriptional regulator/predicted transcriptional regulator